MFCAGVNSTLYRYPHNRFARLLRLKDPESWWNGLGESVREAVKKSGVSTADIASIGVDTTCCSVVALDANVSTVDRSGETGS